MWCYWTGKYHLVSLFPSKFRLRKQIQSFQKYLGGYLFVFVQYLRNHIPIIRAKLFKNWISILAIASHRNWLDILPPLTLLEINWHKFVLAGLKACLLLDMISVLLHKSTMSTQKILLLSTQRQIRCTSRVLIFFSRWGWHCSWILSKNERQNFCFWTIFFGQCYAGAENPRGGTRLPNF